MGLMERTVERPYAHAMRRMSHILLVPLIAAAFPASSAEARRTLLNEHTVSAPSESFSLRGAARNPRAFYVVASTDPAEVGVVIEYDVTCKRSGAKPTQRTAEGSIATYGPVRRRVGLPLKDPRKCRISMLVESNRGELIPLRTITAQLFAIK